MWSRSTFRIQMLPLFGLALATALTGHASIGRSEHIVTPYPSRIALVATPQTTEAGGVVVFAATLTKSGNSFAAGPTGEVRFTLAPKSGEARISATVPIKDGTATWSAVPPAGTDTVAATYPGDMNYSAISAQTTVTALVPASPDFDFTLPSITIQAGQSFNGSIHVMSLNGFKGKVSFEVGQLPEKVTFSIPTSSIHVAPESDPSQAKGYAVSFAVGTQATVVASVAGLFFLGFFGIRRRPQRRKPYALLAILSIAVIGSAVGCAGDRYMQTNGTQPGTYSIPITGTSGNLTHTHKLTLIVTPNSK